MDKQSVIRSAENNLQQFCHKAPGLFWGSLSLNLACHCLAILEVYLVLHFMRVPACLVQALILEALTKLINVVGIFNPGNVGTYEGGNMILAKLIGASSATGLTLSLCRRARSLFWSTIAGLFLITISISNKSPKLYALANGVGSRRGMPHPIAERTRVTLPHADLPPSHEHCPKSGNTPNSESR